MMSKSNWDSVQLYFSGDEYFRDIGQAIDQARTEVLIETYIFELDPIGLRILQKLESAVSRGVRCRLMVDGIGSFNWALQLENLCRMKGIQFRIFHPIPFQKKWLRTISWRSLRRLLFLLRKINKRNHRKIVLIDGCRLFIGGMNISQVHTQEFMDSRAWRDTCAQVQGDALQIIRLTFFQIWKSEKISFFPRHLKQYRNLVRINNSVRQRFYGLRDLNLRIRNAKKRVLITNPYFVPRVSVLRSLAKAAKKGIEVSLCLPAKNDVPLVQWASRSLYSRLLKSNIRIFEYQNQVLHAKTMIIDNWCTVGSHNLNHRSMLHDLEAEIVISDNDSLEKMTVQWTRDIQNSREITLESLGHRSFVIRSIERMASWFRYWL